MLASLNMQLFCMGVLLCLIVAHRVEWMHPSWFLMTAFAILLIWLVIGVWAWIGVSIQAYRQALVWNVAQGLSLALGLLVIFFMASIVVKSKQVPAIHDITTDLQNPPAFVHAVNFRHPAHNSVSYDRTNVDLQKQAYVQVRPAFLDESFHVIVDNVEALILAEGWSLHAIDRDNGVFEAYERTAVLGFVDDIIIRVSLDESRAQVRVDLRSASRVGVSDFGVNALRIQQFLEKLQKKGDLPSS